MSMIITVYSLRHHGADVVVVVEEGDDAAEQTARGN